MEPKKLTLTNGEEILVASNEVCNPDQTLVRMGEGLVAGVVNDPTWSGVYIWQQDSGGVYRYLGDMTVRPYRESELMKFHLVVFTPTNSPELQELVRKNLDDQACGFRAGMDGDIVLLAKLI